MAQEEMSNVNPCRAIQFILKIMSMPSSAKRIRLVWIVLLPNLIGTCLMNWLEAILPPGVDIMYDPFVWKKFKPTFALNFAL
jgi:hypothetical protein